MSFSGKQWRDESINLNLGRSELVRVPWMRLCYGALRALGNTLPMLAIYYTNLVFLTAELANAFVCAGSVSHLQTYTQQPDLEQQTYLENRSCRNVSCAQLATGSLSPASALSTRRTYGLGIQYIDETSSV